MKARGAAIQGGLAALGLVAAYGTWQREPDKAPGQVVVLDVNRRDLERIRYQDGPKWVELTQRKAEDGEPHTWMRSSARTELPKAPEREVRASEAADKLYERFTPLRVNRALGVLDGAKLKELGLEAPKKKLEVTVRGHQHLFSVGSSPYGVSEPYVKDDETGRVYVLGSQIISDLDGASLRLIDRTLHGFKSSDFDALTVHLGDKQRELVQRDGAQVVQAKLASKKTPTKPDPQAKNWHDKIWRLYAMEVLGKDEKPTEGEPKVVLRIDYFDGKKARGFIELGRVEAAPATTMASTAPSQIFFFARTEHAAGWVKVAANDELIKEGEKIVAAE